MSPRPRPPIPDEEAPPAVDRAVLPEKAEIPGEMGLGGKQEPFDIWEPVGAYAVLDELFPELQHFVEALVRDYALPDTVVPPCWAEHMPLLLELESLREFRRNWFLGPMSAPDAGAHWHRELDMAMVRLRRWTGDTGCNVREHREQRQAAWLGEDGVIREHYLNMLTAARARIEQRARAERRINAEMEENEKVRELYERADEAE